MNVTLKSFLTILFCSLMSLTACLAEPTEESPPTPTATNIPAAPRNENVEALNAAQAALRVAPRLAVVVAVIAMGDSRGLHRRNGQRENGHGSQRLAHRGTPKLELLRKGWPIGGHVARGG